MTALVLDIGYQPLAQYRGFYGLISTGTRSLGLDKLGGV